MMNVNILTLVLVGFVSLVSEARGFTGQDVWNHLQSFAYDSEIQGVND